jgi:hypothetical protein
MSLADRKNPGKHRPKERRKNQAPDPCPAPFVKVQGDKAAYSIKERISILL